MTGIYIHLPFCERKCLYCDFPSLPREKWDEEFLEAYIDALREEITRSPAHEICQASPVKSLYFGGGTPSLLSPAQLQAILETLGNSLELAPDCEMTIEANPGTIDRQKLEGFASAGVNRISLGAQSFNEEHLKLLGRIHGRESILDAFQLAREAGIKSIGMDLIYGLPGQSPTAWRNDIRETLSLAPEHISAYCLTPEPGTPLGDSLLSGSVTACADEVQAEMMNETDRLLTEAGYMHYELSNYAKPGWECRHNLRYWRWQDYRGFGSGACSFFNRWRSANVRDPFEYVRKIQQSWSPLDYAERIAREKQMSEFMIMGLRLVEGISSASFIDCFGEEIGARFGGVIEDLTAKGLVIMEENGHRIRVPREFYSLHNEIVQHFLTYAVEA